MTRQVARNAAPTAVESGLKTAASPESQDLVVASIEPERVQEATEKLATGTTDGLIEALSVEERQEGFARAVAPLVSSMVDTAVQQALSDGTLERVRLLAKQATLGFQDAIDQVKTQKEEGHLPADKANVLEAADDVAVGGERIVYILGAAAAGLFLLLILGAAWALRRKREYEHEASSRSKLLDEIRRILAEERGDATEASSARGPKDALEDPERLRQALRRLAEERTLQLQRLFKPSSGPAR